MLQDCSICAVEVKDIRFPTSMEADGSDAMVSEPDYACAYVIIHTTSEYVGHGFSFTVGRGTEVVCQAIKAYIPQLFGKDVAHIFSHSGEFWRELAHEQQLRWIGPEKGAVHLALAAIVNALWDLFAKIENKPLWKLLSDMSPEDLVNMIDFRYIDDVLSQDEALDMLRSSADKRAVREKELCDIGYPAYCMSVGWMGYPDEKIKRKCVESLSAGFTRFKLKVGSNWEDDNRRLGLVRETVGSDKILLTDANQKWGVTEAIDWMSRLAKHNITWIEEPTSPDDIIGHKKIAKALNPLGIGVATGEHAHNRVMFKQLLSEGALQYCQIDACRLGGPNEILAVMLMANKFGVPVCPHAGGVGMCELVQHWCMFDYICLSGSVENRMVEYAEHLHEHMVHPVNVQKGQFQVPKAAGYSSELKQRSYLDYSYPDGLEWQKLFSKGLFKRPVVY